MAADLSIEVEKVNIFDDPDSSDGEADVQEWVSISTSNTISTTSTLPAHLNLKPKPTVRAKTSPPDKQIPSNSEKVPLPLPTQPSEKSAKPTTKSCPPHSQTQAHIHNPTDAQPALSPILLLQKYIPQLTAIYIVSRRSLYNNYHHSYTAQSTADPFSCLLGRGSCPIATTAAPSYAPVKPINKLPPEVYIRVCADCARPKMTIFCNGTWKTDNNRSAVTSADGITTCPAHAVAVSGVPGAYAGTQMCARCTRGDTDVYGRCPDCDMQRDRMLFRAVLKAIDPWGMSETQKLVFSGKKVEVFDMSVPSAGEVYQHVKGCGCERLNDT